jgi:hypothetical protein
MDPRDSPLQHEMNAMNASEVVIEFTLEIT